MPAQSNPGWSRIDAMFLTPFRSQSIHVLRQGRLLVAVSFTLALMIFGGLLLRLIIADMPPLAIAFVFVGASLFLALPWILRASGSLQLASLLAILNLVFILLGVGFFMGGVHSPMYFMAPLIPLLATFLLEPRRSLLITALLCAAIWLPALLSLFGSPLPTPPLSGEEVYLARALLLTLAVLMTAALAHRYESLRRESEHRMRESERLYRRLFEQSKDPVILTTRGGQMLDINQAGVDLYAYPTKEELLAVDVPTTYEDPAEREALLRILARDGFVRNHEVRQKRYDGSTLIVQGTTSTVRDQQGDVSVLLTILRDVTRAKKAAREREALIDELGETNAELERFSRTVSHDLKSPLVTVQGFLALLRRDLEKKDSARIERDLAAIDRATETMTVLIDDLLDLARLGRGEGTWTLVSTSALVAEVVELLAGRIEESRVEIVVDPGLPTVTGTAARLRAVFQNLIENAIKFSTIESSGKAGAPRIHVGVRQDASESVFFVADNGPGLAPEDRERVFDLFEKLSPRQGGRGIGLTIVKRVVELHDGRVWVESEGVGKGCCFCFTLGRAGQSGGRGQG